LVPIELDNFTLRCSFSQPFSESPSPSPFLTIIVNAFTLTIHSRQISSDLPFLSSIHAIYGEQSEIAAANEMNE